MCPVNFCLFSSTRGSMYSVPRDGINSPCSEGKFWSISDQWYMGGRTPALSPSRDHPPAFLRNPNSPDGPPFGGSIGGNGVIFRFQDLEMAIFSKFAHSGHAVLESTITENHCLSPVCQYTGYYCT